MHDGILYVNLIDASFLSRNACTSINFSNIIAAIMEIFQATYRIEIERQRHAFQRI